MKTLSLFLLFGLYASAQPCPKYARAMAAGDVFLRRADYDSALVHFQVALIAARECKINNDSAAGQLKRVFEGIKAQRNEALAATQQAVTAAKKTKEALNKAEKLTNAFYFYEDRFALSVKRGKYGFINKNGDAVISYKYEYAENFDDIGFAKVKKKDHYGEVGGGIFDYLIDTSGKEYLVSSEFPRNALDTVPGLPPSFPRTSLSLPAAFRNYDLYADALDFRNNKLDEIPSTLNEFKKFEILLLGGNKLHDLPASIGDYKALKTLDLSGNDLEELPEEIGKLKKLETLILDNNNLLGLPEEIGRLKRLKTLTLAGNVFEEGLTWSIEKLDSLRKLDLSSTQLTDLPEGIARLKQLRILNIADSRFETFPQAITRLIGLQELDMSGNEYKTFPGLNKLIKLHTLTISYMGLKKLPPEIYELKQLRRLNIYGNDIPAVEQKALQKRLPHCQINDTPPE